MRSILAFARLGALVVPLAIFGADRGPAAAPAPTASEPVAGSRVELSQGTIGPEGGTLVSPDGSVEVVWAANPKRVAQPSRLWTLAAGAGGLSFQITGAAGPATISCFPPGETSPGTTDKTGSGPDPIKPPEPVIEIEDGNGEWREVEAPRQANGARQVRIDDDLAPINATVSARRLFKLVPSRAILALGEEKTFELRPNDPGPILPPESDPTSDDYLPPIAPTPPPGGDSSSDDYLAPLAGKKSATGSSAKPSAKAAPSAADRAIDQKLGEALRRTQQKKATVERWLVQNVPWGNPTLGTIEQGLSGLRGGSSDKTVNYTAPKKFPESQRTEENSVKIYAQVRRGQSVEFYHAPVRLLEDGEVAVEVTCTLVHQFKSNRSTVSNEGIVLKDTEDYSESLTVEGAFVLQMSESKDKRSFWIRQEKRAPVELSYRAHLNRMKSHDERADGEYGKRGDTVTESARSAGAEELPVPSFVYYRDEKKWEASIPLHDWLTTAVVRSSPETHQTFRPNGDPVHLAGLTRGWAIQSLPFDLPKFSTGSAEAEREWTGWLEQRSEGFRYFVKWKIRR